MPRLTAEQVAQYAYVAGFRGEALQIAVAVSGAETDGSFDTDALGDVGIETDVWGPSVGLWQVRSLKAEKGTGSDRDETANHDAAHNATAAYHISGGATTGKCSGKHSGWGHWTTFCSGAYKKYLDVAKVAADVTTRNPPSGPLPALGNTTGQPLPPPVGDQPGQLSPDVVVAPGGGPSVVEGYVPPRDVGELEVVGESLNKRFGSRIDASGSVDLTADEVSEVSFTVQDPGLTVAKTGAFELANPVRWRNWDLEVAAFAIGQGPAREQITVEARDRLGQAMKRNRGAATYNDKSASEVVLQAIVDARKGTPAALEQGSIIQGSAVRDNLLRKEPTSRPGDTETDWDLAARLAQEEGFWWFVANGWAYFGKPSFLVEYLAPVRVGWANGWGDARLDALACPEARRFIDPSSGSYKRTVTLQLARQRGEQVRPGMRLEFAGLPLFDGTYIVTKCSWPLDGGVQPAVITGEEAVDPIPEKPGGVDPPDLTTDETGVTDTGTVAQGGRLSNDERETVFGKPCDTVRFQQYTTPWGITVSVHQLVAQRFREACEDAAKLSWKPLRIDSYACRAIRDSSSTSLHAWALAWDFFSSPPNVPPPGGVYAPDAAPSAEFRQAFKDRGFYLGAEFHSRPDFPHIEWASGIPMVDLAAGPSHPF